MNRVLTAVTFVAIFATPAFAQSYDPDMGTGNIAFGPNRAPDESAYAQAPDNFEYPRSWSGHRTRSFAHERSHHRNSGHTLRSEDENRD